MTKHGTLDSEVRERPAVAYGEDLWIPEAAYELKGFRAWARSDEFPQTGRIDYLAGVIESDMSPEDLHTHGTVKTAIAAALFAVIARPRQGFVFADRTRVTLPVAQVSVEPDVVAVLFSSLDRGGVRQVPAKSKGPGRFVEFEGAPDLVVEILSDSSVKKDTERLPPLYAADGVGELWLVDARGEELELEIRTLEAGRGPGAGFQVAERDGDGWAESPLLGGRIRLVREPTPHAGWFYELEQRID